MALRIYVGTDVFGVATDCLAERLTSWSASAYPHARLGAQGRALDTSHAHVERRSGSELQRLGAVADTFAQSFQEFTVASLEWTDVYEVPGLHLEPIAIDS